MKEERIRNLLKLFLTAIFVCYTSSIILFTHVHIINGITIVHSHIYTSGNNDTPIHEHTTSEIQLIHTLSTFFCFASIFIFFIFGLIHSQKKDTPIQECLFRKQYHFRGISHLRPPPAFIA